MVVVELAKLLIIGIMIILMILILEMVCLKNLKAIAQMFGLMKLLITLKK